MMCSVAFLWGLSLSGQSFDSPVQYFDFFNQAHQAVAQRNIEYVQYAVHSDDLPTIIQKRLALIQEIDHTAAKVKALPEYAQDAGMQAEMLAVLGTYQTLFRLEFEQVEDLKAQSQESFAAMERYLAAQDAAEAQLAAAATRFLQAQRNFATANHIQLIEGAPDPEMTQLSKLNAYQRAIFLESFRLSKQNADFLDAVDRKDADAMSILVKNLARDAQQAQQTLRNLGDFNGHTAYRDAAIRQAAFFAEMAERYYPAMIAVSIKDSQALTQPEVDAYNEAAQKLNVDFNAIVTDINAAMQDLMRQNVPKPNIRNTKQI